jgi:hypothetical protein
MPKLLVTGCSFSDVLEYNKTSWGHELANLLGYEYLHEARGCGSNYRMWRTVTTAIMNGDINHKDLVCIQYTNNDRMEFWSDIKHTEPSKLGSWEPWPHGGSLERFKDGAWSWTGQYPNLRKFFFTYETHFCNPTYNDHMFKVYNLMFQCMLKEFKIPTVFLYTRYKYFDENIELLDPFKSWAFREDGEQIDNKDNWYEPDDGSHLSDHGHKQFAAQVYNHVQKFISPDKNYNCI